MARVHLELRCVGLAQKRKHPSHTWFNGLKMHPVYNQIRVFWARGQSIAIYGLFSSLEVTR